MFDSVVCAPEPASDVAAVADCGSLAGVVDGIGSPLNDHKKNNSLIFFFFFYF